MHLARQHALSSHPPAPAFLHAAFQSVVDPPASSLSAPPDQPLFACATPTGFFVARTSPLAELARRTFPSSQGGLAFALPVEQSSLLLLVGGGRVPRFAPNKLVLWDEAASQDLHKTSASSPKGKERSRPTSDFQPAAGTASSSRLRSDSFSSSTPSETGSIHDMSDEDDSAAATPSPSTSRSSSSSSSDDDDDDDDLDPSMYVSAIYASTAADSKTALSAQPKVTVAQPLQQPAKRTVPPAAAPQPPLSPNGAAVAELEFAEAVTGIEIRPFRLRSDTERIRTSSVAAVAEAAALTTTVYVVVVVLKTKAVIFELGASQKLHVHQQEIGALPRAAPSPHLSTTAGSAEAWSIAHRSTVEIAGGARQGLTAIAPAGTMPAATKRARHEPMSALIALPGRQKGHVQLVKVPLLSDTPAVRNPWPESERSDAATGLGRSSSHAAAGPSTRPAHPVTPVIGASTIIIAHSSALNSITLSPCGRLLITSSDRGTLIRLWSVRGDNVSFDGKESEPMTSGTSTSLAPLNPRLLRELRRGTDQAFIQSVAIAPDLSALAVASDTGTIHIFRLGNGPTPPSKASKDSAAEPSEGGATSPKSSSSSSAFPLPKAFRKATAMTRKHLLPTATSSLSLLPGSSHLKKYLASEWASAHFRVPLRTFGGRSAEAAWGERGGPGGVESPTVAVALRKVVAPVTAAAPSASAVPTVGLGGGFDEDEEEEQEDMFGGAAEPRAGSRLSAAAASSTSTPTPIEALTGGAARSTEGGWAAMRARLDDVRRGEAGLDERIFLTWTRASSSSSPTTSATSAAAASVPQRPQHGSSEAVAESAAQAIGLGDAHGAPAAAAESRYELIALTTGGSWYRIGLSTTAKDRLKAAGVGSPGGKDSPGHRNSRDGAPPPGVGDLDALQQQQHPSRTSSISAKQSREKGSLDRGAEGQVDQLPEAIRRMAEDRELEKSGVISGCVLLEFRRFGQRDEWVGHV